jgi:TPR repeat protein
LIAGSLLYNYVSHVSKNNNEFHKNDVANQAYAKGDFKEAVKLYQKEADAGNVEAQNNLAVMYEEDKGIQPNYSKAVHYYTLAAEQGSPEVKFNLARNYYNGSGVDKNTIIAHALFSLCASDSKDAMDNKDLVASELSIEQIEQSKELTSDPDKLWKLIDASQQLNNKSN